MKKVLFLLAFIPLFGMPQSTDVDQNGNVFEFTTIGNQTWSLNHPKISTYRDGTAITNLYTDWGGTYLNNEAIDVYAYIDINDPNKGRIYNLKAILGIHSQPSMSNYNFRKKFAPPGWRLPKKEDFEELVCYLMENGHGLATESSVVYEECSDGVYQNPSGGGNQNNLVPSLTTPGDWSDWQDWSTGDLYPSNNSSGFNISNTWIGVVLPSSAEVNEEDNFALWSITGCLTADPVDQECLASSIAPEINPYQAFVMTPWLNQGMNVYMPFMVDYSLLNVRFIKDEAPTIIVEDITAIANSVENEVCSASIYLAAPQIIDDADGDYPNPIQISNNYNYQTGYYYTFEIGETVITWTAEDPEGNISTAEQTFTVVDDTNPTMSCNDISLTLENGIAVITALDLDNGSADSCGGDLNLEINQTEFNESHIGDNVVVLTGTDQSGNSSTCQSTVTIEAGMGIDDNTLANISLYPNPSSNLVFIKGANTDLEAVVFDLLGKELIRENINGRLDISCLEKGTYIINLGNGINTSSHKIIKN